MAAAEGGEGGHMVAGVGVIGEDVGAGEGIGGAGEFEEEEVELLDEIGFEFFYDVVEAERGMFDGGGGLHDDDVEEIFEDEIEIWIIFESGEVLGEDGFDDGGDILDPLLLVLVGLVLSHGGV